MNVLSPSLEIKNRKTSLTFCARLRMWNRIEFTLAYKKKKKSFWCKTKQILCTMLCLFNFTYLYIFIQIKWKSKKEKGWGSFIIFFANRQWSLCILWGSVWGGGHLEMEYFLIFPKVITGKGRKQCNQKFIFIFFKCYMSLPAGKHSLKDQKIIIVVKYSNSCWRQLTVILISYHLLYKQHILFYQDLSFHNFHISKVMHSLQCFLITYIAPVTISKKYD